MAKRKVTLPKLKKKLDLVFGKFIRARDKDENGWAVCCTCNKPCRDGNVNAGHWISRGFLPTRYEETNVNAQCVNCNNWLGGRADDHERFIEKKHGKEEVERLRKLKLTENFKFTKDQYEELIIKYTALYDSLKEEKGF